MDKGAIRHQLVKLLRIPIDVMTTTALPNDCLEQILVEKVLAWAKICKSNEDMMPSSLSVSFCLRNSLDMPILEVDHFLKINCRQLKSIQRVCPNKAGT